MTPENRIYIVYGVSGEYEDRRKWNVCAYATAEEALRHAFDANERVIKLESEHDYFAEVPEGANEYDPEMSVYAGRPFYGYSSVPLKGKSVA